MYAIIDNKPVKVTMIDRNYDVDRNLVEVKVADKNHCGYRMHTVISSEDIREEVTTATKQVIVKVGKYNGSKTTTGLRDGLRVNKAGNVECYVWNNSKCSNVFKTFKPWEVSAVR